MHNPGREARPRGAQVRTRGVRAGRGRGEKEVTFYLGGSPLSSRVNLSRDKIAFSRLDNQLLVGWLLDIAGRGRWEEVPTLEQAMDIGTPLRKIIFVLCCVRVNRPKGESSVRIGEICEVTRPSIKVGILETTCESLGKNSLRWGVASGEKEKPSFIARKKASSRESAFPKREKRVYLIGSPRLMLRSKRSTLPPTNRRGRRVQSSPSGPSDEPGERKGDISSNDRVQGRTRFPQVLSVLIADRPLCPPQSAKSARSGRRDKSNSYCEASGNEAKYVELVEK